MQLDRVALEEQPNNAYRAYRRAYELRKRYTPKHNWHLILADVPNRQLILIHAANDAIKELLGCIAPVSVLTAEGKGLESRKALKKITAIVFHVIDQKKQVFITIKS